MVELHDREEAKEIKIGDRLKTKKRSKGFQLL